MFSVWHFFQKKHTQNSVNAFSVLRMVVKLLVHPKQQQKHQGSRASFEGAVACLLRATNFASSKWIQRQHCGCQSVIRMLKPFSSSTNKNTDRHAKHLLWKTSKNLQENTFKWQLIII